MRPWSLISCGDGVTSDTFERAEALLKAGADAIVIDTAHGHSAGVLRKIREIQKHSPRLLYCRQYCNR